MRAQSLRQAVLWGLAAGVMVFAQPSENCLGSLTVNAGYDLLVSVPGTSFPGLGGLVGVPLGTFDFGSGPVAVGNTDTIVQRLSDVTVPAAGDTGATTLEMLALQLETTVPVDFGGAGLDNYFVTLQSARGGPPSTGSADITFLTTEGGTFTSFFDVFFDIRKGDLNGPIVWSDDLTLQNLGTEWGRIAPPLAVTIPGINFHLNGTDDDTDFWPVTPFQESHPIGAVHVVTSGVIPEPATWMIWTTLMFIGMAAYARWRRKRA